jgi:two-component system, chemotaxis family, protein-glutamate methylesterase/glutaminase
MAPTSASRVVVADDSRLMRRVLSGTLADAGFEVVGQAANGDEALELCERLRPDAMTLDLHMPGKDGMAVLRALRGEKAATPVVVVSAFSPAHGARAVDALAEGAFDLVAKPSIGEPMDTFSTQLADKVRAAAASVARKAAAALAAPPRLVAPRRRSAGTNRRTVVIACSTGGPRALAAVVPALPAPLGAGTLIVQHMPPGFTGSLASRLDRESRLNVVEAKGGEALRPGTALLAPGGSHLRLDDHRVVRLSDSPPIGALRPRADLTIADAAKLFGPELLLVVLTGMGKDGLEGAQAVRARGGRILVEAESTCTVYGMPRAVAEAGLADAILPIDQLAGAIAEEAGA